MKSKSRKKKLSSKTKTISVSERLENFTFCFDSLSKCKDSKVILSQGDSKYKKKLIDQLFLFYSQDPSRIRNNTSLDFEIRQSDRKNNIYTFRLFDTRVFCKRERNLIKLLKIVKKADKTYF